MCPKESISVGSVPALRLTRSMVESHACDMMQFHRIKPANFYMKGVIDMHSRIICICLTSIGR
jgi:hypothetical protein